MKYEWEQDAEESITAICGEHYTVIGIAVMHDETGEVAYFDWSEDFGAEQEFVLADVLSRVEQAQLDAEGENQQ